MSSSQNLVSNTLDDFIRSKESYYWFVVLNNGEFVYEDDDRPGLEEKNAWKRLKEYCEINRLHIVKVGMVFGSNRVEFSTEDWDGVFFIKSVLGFFDTRRPYKRYPNRYFYHFGRPVDGKLVVSKYQMPGTIPRGTYEREIGETELSVIIHHG